MHQKRKIGIDKIIILKNAEYANIRHQTTDEKKPSALSLRILYQNTRKIIYHNRKAKY
jgi:hypothetical protein